MTTLGGGGGRRQEIRKDAEERERDVRTTERARSQHLTANGHTRTIGFLYLSHWLRPFSAIGSASCHPSLASDVITRFLPPPWAIPDSLSARGGDVTKPRLPPYPRGEDVTTTCLLTLPLKWRHRQRAEPMYSQWERLDSIARLLRKVIE